MPLHLSSVSAFKLEGPFTVSSLVLLDNSFSSFPVTGSPESSQVGLNSLFWPPGLRSGCEAHCTEPIART